MMARPPISLKARALRYLSAREHSRLELAHKLARYAQEDEDVGAVLDALEAAGLLSEARFSESLLHRRAARFGNQRIVSELKSHGVGGAALDSIKAGLAQDEISRARAVLDRKFAASPLDAGERARQIRFLQQRGFTLGAILAALHSKSDIED